MSNKIVPIPEKMEIINNGFDMIIRRKWFSPKFIFLTVFVIFWDGFLVFWYSMATGMDAPLIFKLFPLIHVAVGIGLTYYVIAGYLNNTDIIVSNSDLVIKSYPLPWIGDKTISTKNIMQLYTKEVISRGKNGTSVSYEVHGLDLNDRQIKLVKGLETKEQGLFIEHKIEEYLSIDDAPVAGEV